MSYTPPNSPALLGQRLVAYEREDNEKMLCRVCDTNATRSDDGLPNCNIYRMGLTAARSEQRNWNSFEEWAYEMGYDNLPPENPRKKVSSLQFLSARVLVQSAKHALLINKGHDLWILPGLDFCTLRTELLLSHFDNFLELLPLPVFILNAMKKQLFYDWLVYEMQKLVLANDGICCLKLNQALNDVDLDFVHQRNILLSLSIENENMKQ